jgi:uncharacterized protein YkwD
MALSSHPTVCLRTLLVAISFASCAASSTRSSTVASGSVAPGVELSPHGSERVVPSDPRAEVYTTETSAPDAADPLATQLAAEIEKTRRKHGLPPMVHDGRLDRAARNLVALTAASGFPAPGVIESLLSYYGIVDPRPRVLLKSGNEAGAPDAVASLEKELSSNSDFVDWRRFGIGIQRVSDKWMAFFVFNEKHVDLAPVPHHLPSGGSAPLVWRIPPSLHSPEVLVTPPDGPVIQLPFDTHQGSSRALFRCNQGNGTYRVEIAAEGASGPMPVANFPMYCGVAPPPLQMRSAPIAKASSPTVVEDQLFELMNGDRQAHGLAPLVRDERLSRVARRYSQEMSETGVVAHVSRRSGGVGDRVEAAGISPLPTILAENVATDLTAAAVESGFMSSPGHRDNILNPTLTRVGVGVAVGRESGGFVPLFFTQVFAGFGQ